MPNLHVLLDSRQCFKPDGSINEELLVSLGTNGLFDKVTLVIDDFHMDGRLRGLYNYLWWEQGYTTIKTLISLTDLYLMECDNKAKFGGAYTTQRWADEAYSTERITQLITNSADPAALKKILLYDCLEFLINKQMISNQKITIKELAQQLQNPEFAIKIKQEISLAAEHIELSMPGPYTINDFYKDKSLSINVDYETLLGLGESLAKLDSKTQEQTVATYQQTLLEAYQGFYQQMRISAEKEVFPEFKQQELSRFSNFLRQYYAARNIFYLGKLRAAAKTNASVYTLKDLNQRYIQITGLNEKDAILYIGNPEDIAFDRKAHASLPTITCISLAELAQRNQIILSATQQLFAETLKELQSMQAVRNSNDAVFKNDLQIFIKKIAEFSNRNHRKIIELQEIITKLILAIQKPTLETLAICRDLTESMSSSHSYYQQYQVLAQPMQAILLDLNIDKLRHLKTTKDGQLIQTEIDAVITTTLKIKQAKPEQALELFDITSAVITAIEKPEQETINQCQAYAQTAQGHSSILWKGLGIALMALGIALGVLGVLLITGTVGLATIPGAGFIAASVTVTQIASGAIAGGSVGLISGAGLTFFGRQKGLSKGLDNLCNKLIATNKPIETTSLDLVQAPLLQN